jgi:hypothetical protein
MIFRTNRVGHSLLGSVVVDLEDVRVRQRGYGLGLALEPGEPVWILRDLLWQDLDRHVAVEIAVPRPVDLAHPPCAERSEDLVASETVAGRDCHD